MRVMQSFLMFFYILDQCYEQCPENDLGGFLGSISPELWEDGKPMDKAVYNDWKDRNDVALLNNQNIISATLDFLQFYQTKFGFDFSKTQTIFYKGIMPSEKVLDFPVDCNTLTGSVNL